GQETQVLGHGEVGEDAPALGQGAHAGPGQAVGGDAVDVAAHDVEAAVRGREVAGHRLGHRALAGAVGADEGDDLSPPDAPRHPVQHLEGAVPGDNVTQLQHGCG